MKEADHEQVSELLADWELARSKGIEIPPNELCRDHPHLLPEILDAIDKLESTDWMVGSHPSIVPESPASFQSSADLIPSIEPHELISRLSKFRILTEADLNKLTTDADSQSAEDITKELVDAGKLTIYQRKALLGVNHFPLAIDRYTVIDVLGAGGMGIVFRARHQQLDRLVAIKTLTPLTAEVGNRHDRFVREIKSLSRLKHPNIVGAQDALKWHDQLYLVMELAEGKNLATLIREHGPLPSGQAVSIIYQVTSAIQFAHQHGVIHRDVKPSNVIVDQNGTVKVLDLGLAKLKHEQDQLTQNSGLVGTPSFMAPELFEGNQAESERSDIYAIGCTFYFLLTGHSPFEKDSPLKTLLAHASDPVPQIPANVEGRELIQPIIDSTLCKDPIDRANATQLIDALTATGLIAKSHVVYSEQTSETIRSQTAAPLKGLGGPSGRQANQWGKAAFISLALVLITVIFVFLFNGFRSPSTEATSESLDRKVAKWILSYESSSVEIQTSIGLQTTSNLRALPDDEFKVTGIELYAPTDPPDFEVFSQLDELRWVSLSDFSKGELKLTELARLKNLQGLYLENCELEAAALQVIAKLGKLELLDLSFSSLPKSTTDLYDFSRLTNLKEVYLADAGIDNDLLEKLKLPASIEQLDLSFNQLSDRSIQALTHLQQLKGLHLANCNIGNPGIQELESLPKLEQLDLSGTEITSEAIKHLREIGTLKSLAIADCKADEAWIANLATLPHLSELDISDNRFTDAGIPAFSKLKGLKTLTISNLNVSDETLERLQKSLPNCDFLE